MDTYSFTRAGTPFFYQSWLAALVFWKTYQAGGLALTFFLRAVIIAVTYTVLWFLVKGAGAGPRLASLLVLLAALAGSNNWSFRPQLFIYPIFLLVLYILTKWGQGKNRWLWLLPILSMLWVNLHGSFPLLFILGGFAFLFGRGDKKQLAYALAFSFIAIFINPRGNYVLGYVQNMLSAPSNQLFSVEWMPMVNRGWQANLFYMWLLLFRAAGGLFSAQVDSARMGLFYFFRLDGIARYSIRDLVLIYHGHSYSKPARRMGCALSGESSSKRKASGQYFRGLSFVINAICADARLPRFLVA